MSPFDPIEVAIRTIAAGGIVVVADDENRENEGDLIMAADAATPEAIAFFVRHTSGVICAALTGADCDRLELPLMVPPAQNADQFRTAFTVTVDLAHGTTTGISAADRAATLNALPEPLRSQMLNGDFAAGMEDSPWQVIPTGWVDAAMARWKPRDAKGEMSCVGVDVARGGRDETVIARRHGNWYDEPLGYPGAQTPDGPAVAGLVRAFAGRPTPRSVLLLVTSSALLLAIPRFRPGHLALLWLMSAVAFAASLAISIFWPLMEPERSMTRHSAMEGWSFFFSPPQPAIK